MREDAQCEPNPASLLAIAETARLRDFSGAREVPRPTVVLWFSFILAAGSFAAAPGTNLPTTTNALAATESVTQPAEAAPRSGSSSRGLDDSAFRIVAERNIFNGNRSGGQVRLSSSRRPARVESFTLVGTLAYEKGAFAFFAGSSAEFSKVIKANGVIAGHKVVDVLANRVKLEADGRILDLPIGSAMRREDEGTWQLGEGVISNSGSSYASNRENRRSSRSSRPETASEPTTISSNSSGDQSEIHKLEKQDKKDFKKEAKMDSKVESEILKRLMERREKESQ